MLPEKTCLGKLDIVETYDYLNGPSLFYAKNLTGGHYLVYWCDYENEQDGWLYLPISERKLSQLRRKEISIRKAFETPEQGFYLAYTGLEKSIVSFENIDSINLEFLPPDIFYIEYIDVVNEDADWIINFTIKNLKNKGALATEAMSACVECFHEIMEALGSKKMYSHSAVHGSFELKLGAYDQESTFNSLIKLSSIINSNTNEMANISYKAELDPYLLKEFFETIRKYRVKINIKSKYVIKDFTEISILGDAINSRINLLAENNLIIIPSIKIPQANDLSKVIIYTKYKNSGTEVTYDMIDGLRSKRQVDYYAHAALILGLVNRNYTISSVGQYFSALDRESQMQFLADRFETCDAVVGWLKWSDTTSIKGLDPNTAADFLIESVPSLSPDTSKRRSNTLKNWLLELKPHYRGYQKNAD